MPSTPRGPCLTMASSTPRSSSASAALRGLRLADGDLALLAVADRDGDVLQCALHLLGGRGRATPRTSAGSRGRAPCGVRSRASQAAKCALRLGSSDSPVTVDQYSRADRTASASISSARTCRSGALRPAVEVQREIVGREDLAERHRGRVFVVGRHVAVVDAEVGELGADELAERVVADAGDQRGAVAQPRRGDGDVGGAATEKLAERFDVLEADTDLQGIDVDATAADREHVVLGLAGDRLRTHQLALPTVFDGAAMTVPSNTRPVNSLS